jgi:glycolate oxidase
MPSVGSVDELKQILSDEQVVTSGAAMRAYDCDAYPLDKSKPFAVVFPRNTEEVSRVVRWCGETETPFVPRGAGTGLSGGALAAKGGVVISTKGMTQLLELDVENRVARVQSGHVNLKLTQAASEHGLYFAPDPSSQSVSTLGGNIAENSGGPHTLKYGVTAQHVFGLTMVGFDGEVIELGGPIADHPDSPFIDLIVGSEGTVGIVTEAWVKLSPDPAAVETVLASFSSTRAACETVAAIISVGIVPAALEIMDRKVCEAVKAAFGLEYPEGSEALLLIECDGEPEAALTEIQEVRRICEAQGSIGLQVAADEEERAQLWKARKKGIGALGRIAPTLVTHDGVIPRSKLPEMLDFVSKVGSEHGLITANIFHAGDGNLHPVLCFDEREPGMIHAAETAGQKIIEKCIELGGSITGEHGVGVEKLDAMKVMFSEDDLRLQMEVRSIFHQSELCNPCKVLPNQKGCVEHMRRWRGAAT